MIEITSQARGGKKVLKVQVDITHSSLREIVIIIEPVIQGDFC